MLVACAAPESAGHPVVDPLQSRVPTSGPPTAHGTTTGKGPGTAEPTFNDVLVVVSGHAYSSAGVPLQGIEVGFQQEKCAACDPYLGKTDAVGAYEISLPSGTYVAACSAGQEEGCVTTSADDVVSLDRSGDSVDFVVDATAPPDPGPTQDNPTNGSKADLSGHVTDSHGKPIPGATIELLEVGNGRPRTVTDANGFYEINIEIPSTVECLADPELDCSAKGMTAPVSVDSGQPPQVIDWVAR